MLDTTKLKADDIRNILVNDYGIDASVVNELKGKAALSDMLNEVVGSDEEEGEGDASVNLSEIIEAPGDSVCCEGGVGCTPSMDCVSNNNVIEDIPPLTDPKWHDYVMSQFVEEELIPDKVGNKNPTTAGLRRVVQKLIGPILRSGVTQLFPPSSSNGYRAITVFEIEIMDRLEDQVRVYSDIGEASANNTPAPYDRHLLPTSTTKAEGRVLRKLLMLRNVVAAEELAGDKEDQPMKEEDFDVCMITENQIGYLDTLGKRCDIDLKAFINAGKRQYKSISDITYNTAASMVAKLGEFQRNLDKVPEVLKGYQPNWKS